MFRRPSPDGVACRPGGEHAFEAARLRVVVAHWNEYLQAKALIRDAEAQHWLGSDPATALSQLPQVRDNPLMLTTNSAMFIGIERCTGRLLADIDLHRATDGTYEVGGVIDPVVRARGFGREAMESVCRIAHRHFGIARLRAVCETTNVASQRWLTSCGFVRTDGPARHVLPNGRVIESLWWQRVDETARRRCRRGGPR